MPRLKDPFEDKHRLTLSQLCSYDDILTDALVDHVHYWATIRKNINGYEGSRYIRENDITPIIAQEVVRDSDFATAEHKLLQTRGLRKFYRKLTTDKAKDDFCKHMRRYASIYLPDCPFEVTATNRYTLTTYEAAVTARSFIRRGEQIKHLSGLQVNMTPEEEADIKSRKRDFSVVVSSRSKVASLFLGPARFANHDCDANAELVPAEKNMMVVVARKDIDIGDEITVTYSDGYFGEDNCECLCVTCENRLENGWEKFDENGNRILPLEVAPAADDEEAGRRVGLRKRRTDTNYRDIMPPAIPEETGEASRQYYKQPKGFANVRENLAEDGTLIVRRRRKNLPKLDADLGTPMSERSVSPVERPVFKKPAAPPVPVVAPKPKRPWIELPAKYMVTKSIFPEAVDPDFQQQWVSRESSIASVFDKSGANADADVTAATSVADDSMDVDEPPKSRLSVRAELRAASPILISNADVADDSMDVDEPPRRRRQPVRVASRAASPVLISSDDEDRHYVFPESKEKRREREAALAIIRVKMEKRDVDMFDLPPLSPPRAHQPPKRGRGRPKKVHLPMTETVEKEGMPKSNSNGKRPRTDTLPSKFDEPQTLPRKHGSKPPGQNRRNTIGATQTTPIDIDSDDIPLPVKRKIDPNSSSLLLEKFNSPAMKLPVKRKPGRPRLRALSLDSDDTPISVIKSERVESNRWSDSEEELGVLTTILNNAVKEPKLKNKLVRPRKVSPVAQRTMHFGTSPKPKSALSRPKKRKTLDFAQLAAASKAFGLSLGPDPDEEMPVEQPRMQQPRVQQPSPWMDVLEFGAPPEPIVKARHPGPRPRPSKKTLFAATAMVIDDDSDSDLDFPIIEKPKQFGVLKRSPTKQEVMAAVSERPVKIKAFRTKQVRHSTSSSSMAATSFYAAAKNDVVKPAEQDKTMTRQPIKKPRGGAAHKRFREKQAAAAEAQQEPVTTPKKKRIINPMYDDPPTDSDYELFVPSPLIRRLKRPTASLLRNSDSASSAATLSPRQDKRNLPKSPLKNSRNAPSPMEISSSSESEELEVPVESSSESEHDPDVRTRQHTNRLPSPATDHEPLARTPGDYVLTSLLLPLPTSAWMQCSICDEQFVHSPAEAVADQPDHLCCPRCERHSRLYGLVWPRTQEWDGRSMVERSGDWISVVQGARWDESTTIRREKRRAALERVAALRRAAMEAVRGGGKIVSKTANTRDDQDDVDAPSLDAVGSNVSVVLNGRRDKGKGKAREVSEEVSFVSQRVVIKIEDSDDDIVMYDVEQTQAMVDQQMMMPVAQMM